MTKFDQFIHDELKPRLPADETITVTGFLFTKSLGLVALAGPLALAGSELAKLRGPLAYLSPQFFVLKYGIPR